MTMQTKLMSRFKKILKFMILILLILLGVHLSIEPLFIPRALHTPAYHSYFPRYIAHHSSISKHQLGSDFGSIQDAVASYIDGIEVEVKFSKDNIPFVYHYSKLEDATDGYGLPEKHTWDELQRFKYNRDQTKILSLEEVFNLVGSLKYILVNVKGATFFNKDLARKISHLIQKYYLHDTVIVGSFNPLFLMSMRRVSHEILLMYSFTRNEKIDDKKAKRLFDSVPWIYKQSFLQKQVRRIIRPDILGLRWNFDDKTIKYFSSHGYPVIYGTVDNAAKAEKLFQLGVKGVQTNNAADLISSTIPLPQKIYDAGGSSSKISKVMHVKTAEDIVKVVWQAREENKKITIAGRRHSMGGQTLLDGSIQINMLGIDHVYYNSDNHRVIVGAGATWKKIQSTLDKHKRSVKVMQSDNIFTVGGSISANVHGWQIGELPIVSTIVSMKIITAQGKILTISKQQNTELFSAIVGGYGQLGIIFEAELITTPNSGVKFHAEFMEREKLQQAWSKYITDNPNIELAYSRLSVDRNNLFKEVGLFYFERMEDLSSDKISPESLVAFKRAIFRTSQYLNLGKKIRWSAEKMYAKKMLSADIISRNNAMNADIHILWPLYGSSKDILHEYFIPKGEIDTFLSSFKRAIIDFKMNILNVTIREVKKDNISLLPYATDDMFGIVCLFSQKKGVRDEIKMQKFTSSVIDEVIKSQGTFYLPYRLHYSKEQLLRVYPGIKHWIQVKNSWDPESIFDSQFFQHVKDLGQ